MLLCITHGPISPGEDTQDSLPLIDDLLLQIVDSEQRNGFDWKVKLRFSEETVCELYTYCLGWHRFTCVLESLAIGGNYMLPQRETLTDSLTNIIQILQLGYRSGTLTVEREAGQTIEEGYIVFVNGRVVDAQTNQHRGLAAFNYLQIWGSCRFSFINASDTNATSPSGSHASNQVRAPFFSAPLAPTDGYGRAVHSPFPRLSQAGEGALSHPESAPVQRIHRRMLLLINGQRNLTELARLMARSPDEAQVLLDDLEKAGLIHQ